MPRKDLTQQQEIFCQEYIKTGNAYSSYLVAYPKAKTWKRSSVDPKACNLLKQDKIQARITKQNAKINSALENNLILNKSKILHEIIRQYTEASGNGAAERTNSVALLKLLAQISKLLDNSPAITINNNTQIVAAEVSDYLNL